MTEYDPFEDDLPYSRFIVEAVKPFIDANYRTKPDRPNTGIMGSSLGGLISLYMILEHPDIFSKAGCFSTSVAYVEEELFSWVRSKTIESNSLRIYFDYSGKGKEGKLSHTYEKIRDLLISKGMIL